MTVPLTPERGAWLTPAVRGIGAASLFSDLGHEVPTALLPSFLTSTLGAPAAALGLIEGVADGLAGAAKLAGGALADDPAKRRTTAVGGYTATAVLSSLIGVASAAWQVGMLRTGAWVARGLRVPARNALLADAVPAAAYGRAYGFERAMDNLGAIGGPLLALALVAAVGVREAILLSVIPGLVAALAIVFAVRHIPRPKRRSHQPLRLRVRPVLRGRLGVLMRGVGAFEIGNIAATLLILRATELLTPGRGEDTSVKIALGLYAGYNLAATVASIPAGRVSDRHGPRAVLIAGGSCSRRPTSCWRQPGRASPCSSLASSSPGWASHVRRPPSTRPSPPRRRPTCGAPPSGCSPRPRASETSRRARSQVSCGRSSHRRRRSSTRPRGC